MKHVVRGVFTRPEAAQDALNTMIHQGIAKEHIAFRSRFASDREVDSAFPVYETLGAALLSERVMSTLSSTGFNLVGNSSLIDTELGDIGRLLAEVADSEAGIPPVRIDVVVKVDDPLAAERVVSLLESFGAKDVRTRVRE